MTMVETLQIRCRNCPFVGTPQDVPEGLCILCRSQMRRCHYCRQHFPERGMYHVPPIPSTAIAGEGRLDRWICADCWRSPAPPAGAPL